MHAAIERTDQSTCSPTRNAMEIRVAHTSDSDRLFATLTSAFINDPPARWLFPGPERYLRHFPGFARAFAGGALQLGTAWQVHGGDGCALWFPPGVGPEEAPLMAVIEDGIPSRHHAEVFAVLEALGEAHPRDPHWYLPLIGVDSARQGRGLGAALLRETLRVCDRDGAPAYLEASSPRSIPLYERFGFRRLEPLRIGSCPPITPMWREPASPNHASG